MSHAATSLRGSGGDGDCVWWRLRQACGHRAVSGAAVRALVMEAVPSYGNTIDKLGSM